MISVFSDITPGNLTDAKEICDWLSYPTAVIICRVCSGLWAE